MKQGPSFAPEPAGAAPGGQIHALTATSAVAAVLVFIHHFGPADLFPQYLHVGNIAVGYFFVLSGFVLYLAYNGRRSGYAAYLRRRVARIVPVYLLALFLVIFPPAEGFAPLLNTARALKEAALSAALLQAYIPTYPLTLNLPAWTISVEMFFYLLFPALLRLEQRSFRFFALLSAALFVLSQGIHLYYYPIRQGIGDTICDLVFFSPYIHLNQFLLGMICGHVFVRVRDRLPRHRLLPVVMLGLCIAAVALRVSYPRYLSFQVGLMDPLFMLLILSIAVNNPPALRLRPLVFLGEISYGIYILQWPLYLFLAAMNERHWHLASTPFFWTALAALTATAAVVYYLFELPVKRVIVSRRTVRSPQNEAGNNAGADRTGRAPAKF